MAASDLHPNRVDASDHPNTTESKVWRFAGSQNLLLHPAALTWIIVLSLVGLACGQSTCIGIVNINATATPLWKGECLCVVGYIWNPTTSLCDACSAITGTTGGVQGSCNCVVTKIWRGSTRTCILPTAIDCSVSPNDGLSNPGQTPKACNCISGYYWSSYFLRCQIMCTGITYYNMGVKPTGQSNCPCITNTVWNAADKACKVNCSNIPFATVPAKSYTECPCLLNFVWSNINATCNINCSAVYFSTGWVSTSQCTC